MRVKVLVFDKWKETPEQFERRANGWVQTAGQIVGLRAAENVHTGEIVFAFFYEKRKLAEQELCLIAWTSVEVLEDQVNHALAGIEESGREGKFINIVTTAKSARALAVFIVEGSGRGASDDAERSEEQQEKKQDQGVDAKPKRGRKRKVVL